MTLMVYTKSPSEIEGMRKACRVAADVLNTVGKSVVSGITTKELENIAAKELKSFGAKSAFLGYRGYPSAICTSVNDVVIHGIPSAQKLRDGDIIGIDVGSFLDGFCGDVAKTFTVGNISTDARRLINVSVKALSDAIGKCSTAFRVGDISSAIQTVAEGNGFSVSRDFVGHGIGRQLHEDPQIPNCGKAGTGLRLPENCCLAVEVMLNQGDWQVKVLEDNWTVRTVDRKLSAHFEHTVLVKKGGYEILTKHGTE